MTAIACLRILIGDEVQSATGAGLAPLVGKIASAFLESRWSWPRRYGEVAPFAFVLADPRAAQIAVRELQVLAEELQTKLFGAEGSGDVVLLAYEGEETEVMAFAATDLRNLKGALAGEPSSGFAGGKLSRITASGVEAVLASGTPQGTAAADYPDEAAAPQRRFMGVYFLPKQTFVGSGLTARRRESGPFHNFADRPLRLSEREAIEFDLVCLEAAPAALAGMAAGLLFVPLSFSSLVQRTARRLYQPALEALPRRQRDRLAVTVYDTPRDPSFSALAQVKALLSPVFGVIDLRVTDPGFQVQKLAVEAVTSITLVLPDSDEPRRLAAASQFMTERDHYKSRRIWPAITNVRTRHELKTFADLRVPFLTGPAVSELSEAPIAIRGTAFSALPVRAAGASQRVAWVA